MHDYDEDNDGRFPDESRAGNLSIRRRMTSLPLMS
jgi:hypothetical protein